MHAFFADAGTAVAASMGGLFLFLLVLGLLYVVVWLYCLFNAVTRPDFDTSQRVLWVILLLFLHGLGPILYLILARRGGPAL